MPNARLFNVMQYIGRPYFDLEYDDDGNLISWDSDFVLLPDGSPALNADGVPYLKDGVEPLITEEKIAEALDHRSIKRWAWAYHDRDEYTEDDEVDPKKNHSGLIYEGMAKFPHYHIVASAPNKLDLDRFANWLGIAPQYIDIPRGGDDAFWDCVKYLTHEDDKQQLMGKYLYPDEAIHANFDWREGLREREDLIKKYGDNPPKTRADKLKMAVLVDGMTLEEAKEHDGLTYANILPTLRRLRGEYLSKQKPPAFRLNIYIDGDSGNGKSAMSRFLAEYLTGGRYFETGKDDRVTFEGYDGEDCIVWNEVRAPQLIKAFGRTGVLELFDTHPGKQVQQIKGSSISLINSINIINGWQPYDEFLDALAGEYTDAMGNEHKAENKTQTYRRMPLIFCVREETVEVLINKGVRDRSHEFRQYASTCMLEMSFAKMMQRLEGEALDAAARPLLEVAAEQVETIREIEADKIADPELIPDDLMPKVRPAPPANMPDEFKDRARWNEESGCWSAPAPEPDDSAGVVIDWDNISKDPPEVAAITPEMVGFYPHDMPSC